MEKLFLLLYLWDGYLYGLIRSNPAGFRVWFAARLCCFIRPVFPSVLIVPNTRTKRERTKNSILPPTSLWVRLPFFFALFFDPQKNNKRADEFETTSWAEGIGICSVISSDPCPDRVRINSLDGRTMFELFLFSSIPASSLRCDF